MLARSEVVGAWVCSRISARASSAILSHNIPYRLEPVSEFVFGTHNAAFVQAMYEDYLRDPSSVGAEWRGIFYKGELAGLPVIPRAPPPPRRPPPTPSAPAPAGPPPPRARPPPPAPPATRPPP